jgi:hypothetical protein
MAALDLAKAALTRVANENTLTLENVRILAQLGMDAADRWKAKADAEHKQAEKRG